MRDNVNNNDRPDDSAAYASGVKLYLLVSLTVVLLMMVVGLAMRASQAGWLQMAPDLFYELMTLHGAGMVGIAGLAGAGIMGYFLNRYVRLSKTVLYANFALFLAGVASIIGSILIGGYAGGWTFLWPLPAKSMGIWGPHAAAAFIAGLLLIGVGFLAFYFDAAIAIRSRYGSILRGLGLPQLFSGSVDPLHPPTVVASSMVIIVNTLGTVGGAVVLVVTLVNLYVPEFSIAPLLAKNLIYFFGHVFINATIYMSVIAVYELLPLYTKRPWKTSQPFLLAWVAATFMVMAVYPHHLLLDAVMPPWMLVTGQVLSYMSGLPVVFVTAYTALLLVYKSGLDWQAPVRWLVLSMFGWAAGVIPAIVDGTLEVNKVMHNTLWVPGHFHFYLVVGLLPMIIGFSLHVLRARQQFNEALHRWVFWLYATGSILFSLAFLAGGWASVPRRWAYHWEQWTGYDRVGALSAVVVIVVMSLVALSVLRRVGERIDAGNR